MADAAEAVSPVVAEPSEPTAAEALAPAAAIPGAEALPADETTPGAEAGMATAAEGDAMATAVAPQTSDIQLGAIGYDEQGRPGRIHVVTRGDTLWFISDAYLGTPWVWPSIWQDNQNIENPHLIFPDDRIWITPWEMRKVSDAEAAALLAGQPASAGEGAAPALDELPPAVAPTPAAEPAEVVAQEQHQRTTME